MKLNESLYSLYITLCFVGIVILLSVFKKIYFYFFYKKRIYIFPKIGIKGISNIAMTISIAIVLLLFLTIISSGLLGVLFRAYPGWRATIEGILIKVGGLLFGPILGMFIGGITDLFSVALTSGMFHWGFLLVSIVTGLLSGCVKMILSNSKNSQLYFALGSTIVIILLLIITDLYLWFATPTYTFTFFITLTLPHWELCLYITSLYLVGIVIIWVSVFICYYYSLVYFLASIGYWLRYKLKLNYFKYSLSRSQNVQAVSDKQLLWCTKFGSKFNSAFNKMNLKKEQAKKENRNVSASYFLPVLVTVLFTEALVNIFMLPQVDCTVGAPPNYEWWLGVRAFTIVLTIFFNVIVIYPVYRIISSVMRYDYKMDTIENVNVVNYIE